MSKNEPREMTEAELAEVRKRAALVRQLVLSSSFASRSGNVDREKLLAHIDALTARLEAMDAPYHGGAVAHIEALYADQRESRDREEALIARLDAAEQAQGVLKNQLETHIVVAEKVDKDAGAFVRYCVVKGYVPSAGMDKLRAELQAASKERDDVYEAFRKAEREVESLKGLRNILREVVEASDAFDRVAHLSVREDQPDLEATIAAYEAAIKKARGAALRADEVLQAQPPKRSPCCNCAIRCGRCGNELREEEIT